MSLVWLITGGTSGLGLALAETVLAHGHKVISASRNPTKSSEVKEEIANNPNGKTVALDIKWDQEKINSAVEEAIQAFGHVDVLVNNAGYSTLGTVEEVDESVARNAMETDFWGPWKVARAMIPHMRKRSSGTIINISSTAGINPMPIVSPYSCPKFALNAFTECLAGEVEHFGIRVIIIDLGSHDTGASIGTAEITEGYKGSKPEKVQQELTKPAEERHKSDPNKSALRIFEAVTRTGMFADRKKTLRIPLGEDAYGAGTSFLKRTMETFESLKDVASSVSASD